MITLHGIRWRLYQGALIPDVAPHEPVRLTESDSRDLLKRSGAYFIRWISDFDCGHETAFWHVIKDTPVAMESLSANTRSKVRRGLKHCHVTRIGAETIAVEGYRVYRNAFDRYRTFKSLLEPTDFRDAILRLVDDPSWEFWGVRNSEGRLIAYSQNHIRDGACDYSTIKFDPEFLKLYPSYALFYSMDAYYLNHRKLRYVDDGARSISHETNIQTYLIQTFRFRKAYCRLHVVYSRKVGILISILYPFRKIIASLKHPIAGKLGVLLKHEEIRRSFVDD